MRSSFVFRVWRAGVRRVLACVAPSVAPTAAAALTGRILACRGLVALMLAAALGACATGGVSTNRAVGEGYAGVGELVLRVAVSGSEHWYDHLLPGGKLASVEIRYLGIDDMGRAVFERHDTDALAGRPTGSGVVSPVSVSAAPPAAPPDLRRGSGRGQKCGPSLGSNCAALDTRRIAIDLRTTREIRVQGKIIDVLEASPSGVVFRLY